MTGKACSTGKLLCSVLILCLLCTLCFAEEKKEETAFLRVENGILQPVIQYSSIRDPGFDNAVSENMTFCVYVETDHDTDNDGMADLVKVLVQVPRPAVEGKYKAGVIYDPTPYDAGVVKEGELSSEDFRTDAPFDYSILYQSGEKREPEREVSTMEAALKADVGEWNYIVPVSGDRGYSTAEEYNYYLVRGYAVVQACGIGTYGSEGYELCGMDLECDSHKCVVEWLTGNRRAFTDRTGREEIRADWCNGHVAMTGCSYGGTIPFEVATTGVEGLRTIIPFAGIASWYDYTNAQGVSTIFDVSYADSLAIFNAGGLFKDDDWTVFDRDYGAWLNQIVIDQEATNGDYAPIWAAMDYSVQWEKIQCDALVVTGLNDWNVMSKHADLMVQAFEKAGRSAHLVLHQDGHNYLDHHLINGVLWQDLMNAWLAHYLYDIDNGAENLPAVLVQSNLDGSFAAYDTWRDFTYVEAQALSETEQSVVNTTDLASYVAEYTGGKANEINSTEVREAVYLGMEGELAAKSVLDIPENTTLYGVPEIHARLSTDVTNVDGLMITAVLLDVEDDAKEFKAYMGKDRLNGRVPVKTTDHVDLGGNLGKSPIKEFVQDWTLAKAITVGWTDLCNPGKGYDSFEYTDSEDLEAGKYYDYTLYLMPTAYTVEPGHRLVLILTAWDPCRVFLDESFETMDLTKKSEELDYQYSFRVDDTTLKAMIPVAPQANTEWENSELWQGLVRK